MSLHLDAIVYINLDKRPDRRAEMEQQLAVYGLSAERFVASETPGFGILGCGRSHCAVLKLAKERGYKNVLILEDDFEIEVSPAEFEAALSRLFLEQPVFDVCMLAYNMRSSEPLEGGGDLVGRVVFAQTASAYIVQAHYYDDLIRLYEWAMPLLEATMQHWVYANDIVWRGSQASGRWLYFLRRLGRQRAGFSDNAGQYMDHNC
jgi:glycosyl transferase family 25